MVQYFFLYKKKQEVFFLTGFARTTARTRKFFWRPLLRRNKHIIFQFCFPSKYEGKPKKSNQCAYTCLSSEARKEIIVVSSRASGLEAFSHNPADGSSAPLASRPSAKTNYLNQRFLSYWVELLLRRPVISRVKLTSLTTV